MKNKIYYGEYSLEHWIKLIFKKDIVLPEYQRYFVWDERKMKNLLVSIKNEQFVPPITIGNYREIDSGENINLILDGQQRLTSIFLSFLQIFPDKESYKKRLSRSDIFADENDFDNSGENDHIDNIIEWKFSSLLMYGKNKKQIINNLPREYYKDISKELENLNLDNEFFQNNYLGFCYLVPAGNENNEQQKYYSSVFRNINIQGMALLDQESRAALYYLEKNLKEFFDPTFLQNIKVNNSKLDFVRYLSLISEYLYVNKDTNGVAVGSSRTMEKYYEDYIYQMIGNDDQDAKHKFIKIPSEFKQGDYNKQLSNLKQMVEEFGLKGNFESIIDIDLYMFGLVYNVVFLNRTFSKEEVHKIKFKIKNCNMHLKNFQSEDGSYRGELHRKNPAALKYLRLRMHASIAIFEEKNYA